MIRAVIALIVIIVFSCLYFPYISFYDMKEIDNKISTMQTTLPSLDNLDSYLQQQESAYPHIRKGLEKSIKWYDKNKKTPTEYSFVYLPGFTATRKEIAPVIEILAQRFKANSFYSRLPSHGEEADDYSNAQTEDFFETAMEAVLIGQKLGKKSIYVGLSTGAALLQYTLNRVKSGYAFIGFSPAFYSRWHFMNVALNPWIGLSLVKLFVGNYYEWKPRYPDQELYWNTKYNTDILPHMARVFQITSQQDYVQLATPYFLIYNEKDTTIHHKMMLEKWAQATSSFNKKLALTSRDLHVVAGDITSPENTNPVIEEITRWLDSIN